ncbi:MAG: vWA domain-containing protein [Candidatus Xenobia bacterium]
MFEVSAFQNPYVLTSQTVMQAVLSVTCHEQVAARPPPLALGILIDRSASMGGPNIEAARDAAIQVVQAADEHVLLMVVAFDDQVEVLVQPMTCTAGNKKVAIQAIQRLQPNGSTCMSLGLYTVLKHMTPVSAGRARKILFLTDGKNEGESHAALQRIVDRLRNDQYEVTAWGIGTAWEEKELRFLASETLGQANIIPSPAEMRHAFTSSFAEMRQTAASNVKLNLWTPAEVAVRSVQQMYPSIIPLRLTNDGRSKSVNLGSLRRGEQRDYLVELQIPLHRPGQQYLMARPGLAYQAPGQGMVEEQTERQAWIFCQPTDDPTEASRINPYVAHYTHQEELAQAVQAGHEALVGGDSARATRLLGKALQLSKSSGNQAMTDLLSRVVTAGSGTARLNQNATAVERKTLAINAGKTTRLKP